MTIPIIVYFLQEQGLTLRDVFLLQTVYAAVLLLGEIPTGYIADRWGRKPTLIVGAALRLLGIALYCTGMNFWAFLIAELAMGAGQSFLSGTFDAYAYDVLLEAGRTKEYRRVIGMSRFYLFTAEGIASLIGGYLVTIHLRLPFLATLLPLAAATLIALFIREPRRHKLIGGRHLKQMWQISMDSLVRHPSIRMIIILNAILGTLGLSLFWFTQPYQTMLGVPLVWFGVIHAIVVISGAIASKYLHTMERLMDDRLFLLLIAVVMVGGFLLLGSVPSLPVLLVFPLVRIGWAFAVPLTSDMINRMTDSSVRATVLSAKAFGQRLLFALIAPLLGYMADVYSLQTALMITGMIGGVTALATFMAMRTVWSQIPR